MSTTPTSFQRVSKMNTAFGNPEGDFNKINAQVILNQCRNIFDEYVELLGGLGLNPAGVECLRTLHTDALSYYNFDHAVNVDEVRDALCDIQVFAMGAQHLMGVDGDADMEAVVLAVMTRFIKDDNDKALTVKYHASKGVTDVYFEGEYPEMIMKSASDQPDAPKGKFLKSVSYRKPVLPDPGAYKGMRLAGASHDIAMPIAQLVATGMARIEIHTPEEGGAKLKVTMADEAMKLVAQS